MKKYLIIGLGNKGEEYKHTRHNIGFLVLEKVAEEKEGLFETCNFGWMAKIKHKGRSVFLLKPDTYMNLSGKAIQYWMQKENISLEQVLVITDDLNLNFGAFRIKAKGSDGGHNGLKSIQIELNTNKYPRFRFGVGNEFEKGRQIDHVLGEWSTEEKNELKEKLSKAKDAVLSFVYSGLSNTMNQFNGG